MTRELAEKYSKESGISVRELLNRRNGKSTELAFRIIADCYAYKNKWHKVENHYVGLRPPTRHMNICLLDQIAWIVKTLGYEGFIFNEAECKVKLEVDI